jgi:uncharacterized membrane protein YeiB
MLLFIAIANCVGVVTASEPGLVLHPHGIEKPLNFALFALVSSHAYPVFAIMFGYGLVQLYNRQKRSGATPRQAKSVLLKRNAWLAVFGLAHGIFLYYGDFLGAYGIVGVVAAAVLLRRGDTFHRIIVWVWGFMLVEAVVVSMLAIAGIASSGKGVTAHVTKIGSLNASSYTQAVLDRLGEWPAHTLDVVAFIMIVWLGMWAARRRILEEPRQHQRLLGWTAGVGLGVGILGSIPQALVAADALRVDKSALDSISLMHNITGMFTGPGYVALFGLIAMWLSQRTATPTDGMITGSLSALGRRSLSGYLFQSVVWVVLLSPYTFDLGHHVSSPLLLGIGLSTITWLVSVIGASAMQHRGMVGPAEKVLRRLAYGPRA